MAGLSRTLGIFGGFVAVVGAAFYPIYFRPLLLPEEYNSSLRFCLLKRMEQQLPCSVNRTREAGSASSSRPLRKNSQ
ncbi:small integral membrane protein 20 isoform X1 [Calonectris borealis]|uniref:small integral membrane protein 20 isoform X1 n=1 Tax=Calonectris borealis TaxID=1323832 RepID=UPI003F4B0647